MNKDNKNKGKSARDHTESTSRIMGMILVQVKSGYNRVKKSKCLLSLLLVRCGFELTQRLD